MSASFKTHHLWPHLWAFDLERNSLKKLISESWISLILILHTHIFNNLSSWLLLKKPASKIKISIIKY